MLTTGLPLILTAGVTRGLPGGSNHYSRDRLAGFGQIEMANMLHSDGSTAAPDPGMMNSLIELYLLLPKYRHTVYCL